MTDRSKGVDGPLTCPVMSDWIAVRLWTPASSELGRTPQVPSLKTGEEPIAVAPSYNVTPSPGSPVPVMIGFAAEVILSPWPPLSETGESARLEGDGIRIVTGKGVDGGLT